MPAPGEPYRPLLALPKKLMDMDPAYRSVSDAFFTAYDPPKTLVVAAAMVADMNTVHAVASPVVPTPGPGLDVGASKTVTLNEPSSVSVNVQIVPPPGKTSDPGSDPGSHQPQFESNQQGTGPETLKSPGKQRGTVQDPGMASRSSTLETTKPTNQVVSGLDPEGISPDQTSRMESTLAPRPHSQLTVSPNKQPDIFLSGLPFGSQQMPKGSPPFEDTAAQPAQSFLTSGASSFAEVYPTAADQFMVTGASDIPGKTNNAAKAPSVMPTGQSNSFEGGDVIAHLSGVGSILATSHGSHALQAVSKGVSIQGDTISTGPVAMTTSETAISVGSAYSISLEGTPDILSTPTPAPTTILVNGAVAVPLQNGVSSTTLTIGAPAIAGTPVSLDESSKLAIDDGGTNIDTPLALTSPDLSKSGDSIPMTDTHQATESVVGSVTLVLHSSNGSLGSLMVDVLHTGGTLANSALTSSQITSTPGPNGKPSGGHNFTSIAGSAQSGLRWILIITFVAILIVWLHT